MLTFYAEKASLVMGNGPIIGEKRADEEEEEENDDEIFQKTQQLSGLNRTTNTNDLVFFAGTDKARVITEILEERGWSRTKDNTVTNFTIKWCLEHQVDWNQFQEGKQLINNIPGQLAFADKINLWYTIRDYLHNRLTLEGNHIQSFLPMTFVLDNENEVEEFLRFYRKHNRTWICKPRYSYAGRGIYVISMNSDLSTVFKFKIGPNNRIQHQPRVPGYLMQEYVSRPLLIKGRKFDIRVHWLVAWTKPLTVFYNHDASAVRLSLNLYREFDFDRATHLTNLSVQENHYRYAFAQESTGMTMSQLNHYFNQCFRPFHPKLCQDWVMTVMQERMHTIIRHVIRASKDKLTRRAGQFGFFGCDFLLDENFRIWLLEINDNPGVGWGNSRLNTTTKPLFEETLNIVFECFEKYKTNQSLLPIECLKNYQLIYNEDDDNNALIRDDNQLLTERLSIRYSTKYISSRTSFHKMMPRMNTSRTSTTQNDNIKNTNSVKILPLVNITNTNSSIVSATSSSLPILASTSSVLDFIPIDSPIVNMRPLSSKILHTTHSNSFSVSITPLNASTVNTTLLSSFGVNTIEDTNERIEPLIHQDDIELERLLKPKKSEKSFKLKPILSTSTPLTRPITRANKTYTQRIYPKTNPFGIQRKKPLDLTTPIIIENRRYIHRNTITPICLGATNKKDVVPISKTILEEQEENETPKHENRSTISSLANIDSIQLCSFN